ncbi:MAG: MoxR family ATPase [Myxococcota bacterium]|nr:MoxR family ATPase [Myxococcota bacterium]
MKSDLEKDPTHEKFAEVQANITQISAQVSQVIQGKDSVIKKILTAIFAGGHVLLEDVPGVGKTTLAKTLARVLNLSFSRIQFTSDLLPSDIVGVQVYRRSSEAFSFEQGPIFAQLVLADEINRTTPKTQSSLLEAMNEKTVSVYRETHELPNPFTVIATQNPTDFQGTYPLPESQLDRFMFRLKVGYPDPETEYAILKSDGQADQITDLRPVSDDTFVLSACQLVDQVKVSDPLRHYIVKLVTATRHHPELRLGISTRAAVAFQRAARAYALVQGRDYVIPDDVKQLAVPTLAHRIKCNQVTGALGSTDESERIIRDVVNMVETPL